MRLGRGSKPRLTTSEAEAVIVVCLTSQQHASISQGRICSDKSQGRICSDKCTSYHKEIKVTDPTLHLSQSQYTDTGPTSPSTDPITPGAWQGSHWSANFQVTGMTRPRKKSRRKRDSNPGSSALEADTLTTRATRRSEGDADNYIVDVITKPILSHDRILQHFIVLLFLHSAASCLLSLQPASSEK